jgi:hypothetical protein
MNAGAIKKLAISGLLLGTAALVPSIALAFSSGFDSRPVSIDARGGIGSFTPASVDPRLAEKLKFSALRGDKMFRFTPAASAATGTRALTIAVRVRSDSAKAINIRPELANDSGQSAGLVQITPTAFNLGVAKGFQKFALPASIRQQDESLPDLSQLGRGESAGRKSRFSPRIEIDEIQAPAVRAVRPLNDQGSYSLDVGGAYKLTRNLDVTAGIRLRSDRDRLTGLTNEQFDSQAVYVGTEFRF